MNDLVNRIAVNPNVAGGKPTIRGTRIPVTMVLELIEDGITFNQIREDYYPSLSDEDIRACLEYAKELVDGEEIQFAEEIDQRAA